MHWFLLGFFNCKDLLLFLTTKIFFTPHLEKQKDKKWCPLNLIKTKQIVKTDRKNFTLHDFSKIGSPFQNILFLTTHFIVNKQSCVFENHEREQEKKNL